MGDNLINVLKNNNAVIENGTVMITCKDMDKAASEYINASIIHELTYLLDTHSTQAYWPAIIKERIKQLKGE